MKHATTLNNDTEVNKLKNLIGKWAPSNAHINAIIAAMQLIWKHNDFIFGDTHWQQKSGDAMGSPPSSDIVTVQFAPKEAELQEKFGN